MIRTYKAITGQNIYDVCLMTYGTLNLLPKLMADNAFAGVDNYPIPGQLFVYDDTLIFNQGVSISNFNSGMNYCTRANSTGGQYYSVNEGGIPTGVKYVPPVISPVIPPITPGDGYFYVLYGNPNIGTDGSGFFTYTDSRLIGLTGYSVYANQINQMLFDDYLTYDATIGKFTIGIDDFALIPGTPDYPASRLQVFLNLVTL